MVDELVNAFPFPDPRGADARGLLAHGGDLAPERLLSAYAQGIFPWYDEDPILWFSPDPRMVLRPAELHVGRSLAKRERAAPYAIKMDAAFRDVIRACRDVPRPGQDGTWINEDMIEAYCELHRLGFAHSVEAWLADEHSGGEERLVGGLYGISLGRAFFGESMFAHAPDASKIAFTTLVGMLDGWNFEFVDCQVWTEHLARFGATEWDRDKFLDALDQAIEGETRRGPWALD
ncbi:MAG: leucyl/phenylalanyl-tRNA--protein transferase [bacterium]|nr:leucyl/phenylalanyl-tRNA--protein transferase [Deltaproteobacteria bacterium]MCP4903363.1 leucyl/phenylalanyl-tRNA--protein transferase [bacterium]